MTVGRGLTIRALLTEGPATSKEVSTTLGISYQLAGAWLTNMEHSRLVTHDDVRPRIYRLTPRGVLLAKRDRE